MSDASTTPEPTPATTTPEGFTPIVPREEVGRGALFALIALPVGVVVWLLIWSLGFIASIVAFGVAFAALWLYRIGARGPISTAGALVVSGVTAVTLLVAFFAGIVLDGAIAFSEGTGIGLVEVVALPDFWTWFGEVLPLAISDYTLDFLIALGFGALGCFAVLRSAFAQAKAAQAAAAAPVEPFAPVEPSAASGGAPAPSPEVAPAATPEAPAADEAPETR